MHAAKRLAPSALGALLALFVAATGGFVIMFVGFYQLDYTTILVGGAALTFSTLVYLFVQSWLTSPATATNLWIYFAASLIGFLLLLIGLLAEQAKLQLLGAALLAFAVLTYLFIHALAALQGTLGTGGTRVAAPTPGQNLEHLLGHALERVPPPEAVPVAAPLAVAPAAFAAAPTGVATAAGPAGYQREPYVPAYRRRHGWVQDLPIVRTVLDDAKPTLVAVKAGRTRGQCSGCGATLTAPAHRPIKIRCPQCGRSARLDT